MIIIGYGIVSDIASPANRGSHMSAVSFLYDQIFPSYQNFQSSRLTIRSITIGPSLGPVLGGALTYAAGWAWIFWFLTIVTVSGLALILLFLPETNRTIVGKGAIPPPRILRLPTIFTKSMQHHHNDSVAKINTYRMPNPFRSIKIVFRKDNAVVVLAWGLMYAVYSV